jgi:hypothetical protein
MYAVVMNSPPQMRSILVIFKTLPRTNNVTKTKKHHQTIKNESLQSP